MVDWPDDPKGYRTPDKPYVTWLQDGKKNLSQSVKTARNELDEDERGGTEFDGIALYIACPRVLEDHFLDLPGTSIGSDSTAAWLYLLYGEVQLSHPWVNYADPRFGSVSCGREIRT